MLGFDGSYGRIAAFARNWQADRQREQQRAGRGTFVPLGFRPGEAFRIDWSEDFAVLGGERTKLKVAHIKLSHSRAFLVRAYLLQTHDPLVTFPAEMHCRAMDAVRCPLARVPGLRRHPGARHLRQRELSAIGPRTMDAKTAVDRVGRGKERQVNMRLLAMANHSVFEPEFCNPVAGWEKRQVEKNVQDARHRLWQPMPSFPDLVALNDWLEQRCLALWGEIPHATLLGSVSDIWAAEQAALMPLPPPSMGLSSTASRCRRRV